MYGIDNDEEKQNDGPNGTILKQSTTPETAFKFVLGPRGRAGRGVAHGGGGGGRGGQDRTYENRGVDPRRNLDISASFFLETYTNFTFSNNFKTKWPKCEEKLNYWGK